MDSIVEVRNLLYPLGLLASLCFSLRFLTQWYLSERAGASVCPKIFWRLSLVGNVLLVCHGFIQGQFVICLTQTSHAVFGWRNLNLMKPRPKSFLVTLGVLVASGLAMTLLYMSQNWLLPEGFFYWARSPRGVTVSPWVHLFGAVAIICFSARFWVQWLLSERLASSGFGASFWRLSLVGALSSSVYFFVISDWVNLVGYSFGIVVCVRNLMLIRQWRGARARSN